MKIDNNKMFNYLLIIIMFCGTVCAMEQRVIIDKTQSNINLLTINSDESYYIDSQSMMFDFLIDENVTNNDPRIRSILYVANVNPGSLIEIIYVNPNAEVFANNIATIFKTYHAKALIPQMVTIQNPLPFQLRNVVVKLKYLITKSHK